MKIATAAFTGVSRGRTAGPNEYEEYVAQTFGDEADPLADETTAAEALHVIARLRNAAQRLGLGVTTQVQDLKGNVVRSDKDTLAELGTRKVRVVFKAREARKYGPRKPRGETPAA